MSEAISRQPLAISPLALVRSAQDVFGASARKWLNTPNAVFEGRTPAFEYWTPGGPERVLSLLEALTDGVIE